MNRARDPPVRPSLTSRRIEKDSRQKEKPPGQKKKDSEQKENLTANKKKTHGKISSIPRGHFNSYFFCREVGVILFAVRLFYLP